MSLNFKFREIVANFWSTVYFVMSTNTQYLGYTKILCLAKLELFVYF